MGIQSRFSDKLANILFLEVNNERLSNIFNMNIEDNVYMPIKAQDIIDKVKSGQDVDSIPVIYFLEAMYFVMGADDKFKFNSIYKNILLNFDESVNFIKGKIYKAVENNNYEDAYILIKGLIQVEENEENYSKLIILADKLRALDKDYLEEEKSVLDKTKEKFEELPITYLYEALLKRDEKEYEGALFALNNYISRGGEENADIIDLKFSLKNIVDYEKGKNLSYEDPAQALKILVPLISEFNDDAILYYHIAVCYRNLAIHEKAIYYLNEALSIDSAMPEVVNELGINYASIGDFDKAIIYLRRAFEATKSVEICTNLIMCYLDAGKIEDAKLHLNIAKKLNPNDEIVIEIDNLFKDM